MIRAYSIPDVRAAEAAAMAGLRDGELMARAAQGLADIALARMPEGGDRAVLLAGSGDNGGDALYAGAHLATRGVAVVAVLVGSTTHESGLAAATEAGVIPLAWRAGEPPAQVRAALAEADVVLDGIAGIGGRPGLKEHLVALPDLVGDDAYVMAVDLPSGCDPAGLDGPPPLFADETVTFSMVKPVHLLPATEAAVGLLTVVEIGVPALGSAVVERLTPTDVAGSWPVPGPGDDKYRRGVLGLVTGGEHYTGAAVLSATAAVTAGVGMVRYVGPPGPEGLLRQLVPEVVFGDGRCQAWAIGSGLDPATTSREHLDVAFGALDSDLPLLLDAGGLDLITQPREAPTLLTPHAGELQRLASRLDLGDGAGVPLAQQVADHLHVTVLLKGAVTVVVPPADEALPIRSQADGPAWLATAGSGDVLTGVCGALLAGGLSPLDAGSLGALVHGVAADDANPGGPVRALDVAHQVGRTVARLLRLPGPYAVVPEE